MKIIVYTTDDPEAPENARALARIRCPMIGKGGKMAVGWGPVVHMAATPEAARDEIQAWWDTEEARYRKLTPKGRNRAVAEAASGYAHLPAFDEAEPSIHPGDVAAAEGVEGVLIAPAADWEEEAV